MRPLRIAGAIGIILVAIAVAAVSLYENQLFAYSATPAKKIAKHPHHRLLQWYEIELGAKMK